MGLYRGAGGVEWEIDVPDEGTQQRERFDAQVANGDLVPVDNPAESEPAPEDGAPAQSAVKAEWVDYAVSQGLKRDEAEALTKAELVEQFGD